MKFLLIINLLANTNMYRKDEEQKGQEVDDDLSFNELIIICNKHNSS